MTARDEPAEILLVEDNPDDVELTIDAFRESGSPHRLHIVENGLDALAFLRREGDHGAAPTPDLVLLDLNLPKRSGYEVLAEIRQDPALADIAVVVLTSSAADSDVQRSVELRATGYLTKPLDLDDYLRVVSAVDRFCRIARAAHD